MTVSAPERKSAKPQAATEKPKKKNWLSLLLVVVALQVVALLFTECVLYVAGLGEEEIFAFDPDLGTKHMVNKRITWRSEGFGCCYFDANGMQEPGLTMEKPANTYRIAVLGDSTVEGLQVPLESKFTRILDRNMKDVNDKNIQFLNFGTSGYSTAQEYVQLKKQVFKFAPDMVVLCYDTRDMFENWSPADATLTNVRPIALHLPGGKLIVDSSSIGEWMKSPRAKYLNSINWLRQNSRIWGLVSATETELSFKNKTYQTISALFTRPGKTIRKLWAEYSDVSKWNIASLFGQKAGGPSFTIQFFEGKDPNALAGGTPNKNKKNRVKDGTVQLAQTAPVESEPEKVTSYIKKAPPMPEKAKAIETAAPEPTPASAAKPAESTATPAAKPVEAAPAAKPADDGGKNYINLMSRTLSSLITSMNDMCREKQVKFVVVSLPAHIGVTPAPGEQVTMFGTSYADEVNVARTACSANNIPFYDLLAPALQLDEKQRKALFYSVHLTPKGHEFIAEQLNGFLSEQAKTP